MYSLKVSKDLSGTNSIFEMYMTVRINKTENVWGLTTKRMRFYGKQQISQKNLNVWIKCHSAFMRLSDFIFIFSLKMQHQWSVCLYNLFPLENFCNNVCFIKNTFNIIMRIFLFFVTTESTEIQMHTKENKSRSLIFFHYFRMLLYNFCIFVFV